MGTGKSALTTNAIAGAPAEHAAPRAKPGNAKEILAAAAQTHRPRASAKASSSTRRRSERSAGSRDDGAGCDIKWLTGTRFRGCRWEADRPSPRAAALAMEADMRRSMRPLAVAAVSVACLMGVPATYAQTQSPKQPGAQSAAPAVSDQKLDAAATAAQRVVQVQQSYEKRIAAAGPSEKERLTGEANSALTKAVTDQGLTVDEYISILQLAQNDPAIRKKFVERINPSGQ
jgi:hypothetical protein